MSTMSPQQLVTIKAAYEAMFCFLEGVYNRTHSDSIGSLLGDLSTTPSGATADPASWEEWLACVQAATAGRVDTRLVLKR